MVKKKEQQNSNLETRPPVVVIMGHVDHGKTSLLDYIRKAKVAEGESGGITQHTGAYQVDHDGRQITFIDTPGHEAFSAMRSRGAKVADIAVLVIAADDGIMPQTKEAIGHIKHAGIPMVVAITKIDKPNADPAKVKNQLLEEQIIIEELKGKVPSVEVSSKTGAGVDALLEIINLVAEVEELQADMSKSAEGVVVEAELNHKRGPTATVIVKEGVLKKNDIISLSSTFGRVKELEDFLGKSMEKAIPGYPAFVVGLGEVPRVGERFSVVVSIEEAQEKVEKKQRKYGAEREVIDIPEGVRVLNLVLRADAGGTLEAIHGVLRSITNEDVTIRVLSEGSGDIMESDVKLASAANAMIVGFRTKVNKSAELFAHQMKVEIILGDVIYDLVENVRAKISDLLSGGNEEVELGTLKVLAIFRTEKSRMIIGGKVAEGEIKRSAKIRVARPARSVSLPAIASKALQAGEEVAAEGDEVIGEGRIVQLKIGEKVVDRVEKGQECGILFAGPVRILVGDILQAYEIRTKSVKL